MSTAQSKLENAIKSYIDIQISDDRKNVLNTLVDYIQSRVDSKAEINLNFICTHNSRRSQLSQLWAKAASVYFGIEANCFSGGTEETAFNENAVAAAKRAGFEIEKMDNNENPKYKASFSKESITLFSKTYNNPVNPQGDFAAVMTCSDADQNCPFIPGATRIPVRYNDPKAYDNTPKQDEAYDETSRQIGQEMTYVFSKIIK
ncbi:arsenate-mycothiol transferase ArsC [Aureibacter tunicatorum]|uniref:Arsenate reductase n=1 Tax=Aureibacter tunicatorum TaxID=866807 RepID=A0AAE4BSC7_9BACT|nr:protein-tyrosine-phosphatase [Aureibacter tunicatorum]MDR6238242.1 arsenate reductase [Aureibacter tunicatorum]BDD03275.1 arsenate reductase [Aureibacter tunicatorum]